MFLSAFFVSLMGLLSLAFSLWKINHDKSLGSLARKFIALKQSQLVT